MFSKAQEGKVFVGEFTLAGTSLTAEDSREFAQWLIDQFDCVAAGSLIWNFDCSHADWSMQRQAQAGVDWKRLTDERRERPSNGLPIFLQTADGGTWLSARDDDTVTAA